MKQDRKTVEPNNLWNILLWVPNLISRYPLIKKEPVYSDDSRQVRRQKERYQTKQNKKYYKKYASEHPYN